MSRFTSMFAFFCASSLSLWAIGCSGEAIDADPNDATESTATVAEELRGPRWGGNCNDPFTDVAPIYASFNTVAARLQSRFIAGHRLHDQIINTEALVAGRSQRVGILDTRLRRTATNMAAPAGELGVTAKMKYHTHYLMGRQAARKENAELWIRTCGPGGWEHFGSVLTDRNGFAKFPIEAGRLKEGTYRMAVRMSGDGSYAEAELGVWPRGIKAVVFDIDGTLNLGVGQYVRQQIDLTPIAMPTAAELAKLYEERGYAIIHLTGRPPQSMEKTREFLTDNGFPRGITLFASEDLIQMLKDGAPWGQIPGPLLDFSSVNFKRDALDHLHDEYGVEFAAAYGDQTNDALAYFLAGVPKTQVWMRGCHNEDEIEVVDLREGKSSPPLENGHVPVWKVQNAGDGMQYVKHIAQLKEELLTVNE